MSRSARGCSKKVPVSVTINTIQALKLVGWRVRQTTHPVSRGRFTVMNREDQGEAVSGDDGERQRLLATLVPGQSPKSKVQGLKSKSKNNAC